MGNSRRRWLLLRGLAREVRHWGDFPAQLQTAFPDDEIVCLDLPGAGLWAEKECPWSVAKIRADVRKRWLELGTAGSQDVILALSLGGMVALDWLSVYPKEFGHAVLINTSAGGLNRPWERVLPSAMATFLEVARPLSLYEREKIILKLTNTRVFSKVEIAERAGIQREAPVLRRNALAQLIAGATFRAPKIQTKASLLFVRGLGDRLCSPRCSARLCQHYGGTLESHSSAGHDLPIDEPRWLIELLRRKFSN